MTRETLFRIATPALATVVALAIGWPATDYVLLLRERERSRRNERLMEEAARAPTDGRVPPTCGLMGLVIASDDQRQGYRLRPNVKGYVGHAPIRVNAKGQRDREYAPTKPLDTLRTVVLGDSHTFGNGVSPMDATFPKVLEVMLRRAKLSQKHEVMNFGVPGYNTRAEEATLELEALAYSPDVIVLQFCPNDLHPPHIHRTSTAHPPHIHRTSTAHQGRPCPAAASLTRLVACGASRSHPRRPERIASVPTCQSSTIARSAGPRSETPWPRSESWLATGRRSSSWTTDTSIWSPGSLSQRTRKPSVSQEMLASASWTHGWTS